MKIINIAEHQGRSTQPVGKGKRRPTEYGSAAALMTPGDRAQFEETRARYTAELRPAGVMEEELVNTIADSEFRLWRMTRIQNVLMERQLNGVEVSLKAIENASRYLTRMQNLKSQAQLALTRLQKDRKKRKAHLVGPVR
jgi:hypothetical protein